MRVKKIIVMAEISAALFLLNMPRTTHKTSPIDMYGSMIKLISSEYAFQSKGERTRVPYWFVRSINI